MKFLELGSYMTYIPSLSFLFLLLFVLFVLCLCIIAHLFTQLFANPIGNWLCLVLLQCSTSAVRGKEREREKDREGKRGERFGNRRGGLAVKCVARWYFFIENNLKFFIKILRNAIISNRHTLYVNMGLGLYMITLMEIGWWLRYFNILLLSV